MATFAVVGAGLAGISLAHRLTQAGHLCTVFEKSRGRGGRLSTRRLEGWQVDHGTQYFTVRSPEFADEVNSWVQKGWAARWFVEPWTLGRETSEPSPDDQQRFVGIPTMNAMVHGLSDGIELYSRTRIDRLERVDNCWRLWDEYGEHYGLFDAVLLTAPLAQSLALLPESAVAQQSALRGARMTPTWAIALALAEPSGISADAFFANDGIVSWVSRDSSKPGRPHQYETWMIHFSPSWTANHLNAADDLLYQQAVHLLERLAAAPVAVHDHFTHRWLHARASSGDVSVNQWDADQAIGLAGDWTMGSRLEDAWLSAQALAGRLIGDYSGVVRS